MRLLNWSRRASGRQVLAVCLVTTLLLSSAVGTAAAEPRLFVAGGSVEASETLVGEDFNVTVWVKNTGSDGGALNIDIRRNGTKIGEERVVVEADGETRFNETIQFDETGTFEITAEDTKLGTVTVTRTVTEVRQETAESRTVEMRSADIPTSDPYTIAVPRAENRSLSLQNWTVEASEEQFTQLITEYTDPTAAGITLPTDESATVVGVITTGSTGGVDAVTAEFAVNRSTLLAAGIEPDELTVYAQNGSTWIPVKTTLVEERTESVVYEARTSEFSSMAIGKIDPVFRVEETSLQSVATDSGQRIMLEAIVSNSGSVAGEFEGQLAINGEAQNTTTVEIPAGAEEEVVLTHTVSSAGNYQVALNDQNVGSVVISDGQLADSTASTTTTTAGGTTVSSVDSNEGDSGRLPAGIPATIAGIDTVLLAGGVALALVVFGVVFALLRRRSGRNTGFDQL